MLKSEYLSIIRQKYQKKYDKLVKKHDKINIKNIHKVSSKFVI